ncbi:hypothetical protein PLICRDRAFT_175688 [Plicaturopsis crispa FD-325 SS-3]|nr:hypothetical protein PLICRDRAFT_175688 [Plicaturopsis crispa FD-325 SS-3]
MRTSSPRRCPAPPPRTRTHMPSCCQRTAPSSPPPRPLSPFHRATAPLPAHRAPPPAYRRLFPRALPTPAARQHQHTRRPAPLHASARTPCMPLASAYASPRRRTLTAPAHDIRKRVPLATSAHASTPRCTRARDPAHACPSALHREPAWCPPRIARGVADERFVCQPRPLRVARA